MTNKVFIDCGGHNGCSVRKFRKLYDPNNEYYIYTFEPNLLFNEYYTNFENHQLINKAIYTKETELNFYIDTIDYDGSSLYIKNNIPKNKIALNKIKTIDFISWFQKNIIDLNFTKIILKLDVEGIEYEILNKMIEKDMLKYINALFIEWHQHKISDIDPYKFSIIYNNTIKYCDKNNITIDYWDAIGY